MKKLINNTDSEIAVMVGRKVRKIAAKSFIVIGNKAKVAIGANKNIFLIPASEIFKFSTTRKTSIKKIVDEPIVTKTPKKKSAIKKVQKTEEVSGVMDNKKEEVNNGSKDKESIEKG